MRLLLFGVSLAALAVGSLAAAGTAAFSLAVEGSAHRVRPGYPSVEVRFRINPPQTQVVELRLCQNLSMDVGRRRCSGAYGPSAFFTSRSTLADSPLTAGRYEAAAYTTTQPTNESNVVRYTITDECGWIGVRGPGPDFPGQPHVLAGAPYPCTPTGMVTGPLELRSPRGGLLTLSGRAFFDAAWDDPTIPELPPIPNLRIELATRKGNSARVRYRAGGELQSHVIRAQTYSVLVVSRGRNDIELVQAPKVTRVRVRRGAAVLVPVTDRTTTTSFDIIQFIHRRCRGRPFLACAAAIRVKRRKGTRAEYVARSSVVRAGQARTIAYKAP